MPSDDGDKGSINGDTKEEEVNDDTTKKARDDICRDFLNNLCTRGTRCKYYHPPEMKKQQVNNDEQYEFCIDFQNRGCNREICKFVHASTADVDRYKKTGDVTLPLARAIAAVIRSDKINGVPICNEFNLRGNCSHRQRCRYWHINVEDERHRRLARMGVRSRNATSVLPAGTKRPAPEAFDYDVLRSRYPSDMGSFETATPSRYVIELERDNSELLARVDALERDLRHERGRYDDLLTLFKQTQAAVQTGQISRIAPAYSPSNVIGNSQFGHMNSNDDFEYSAYPSRNEKYNWM
ncbi:zinc finger CCCH domain-containing protein 10 [Ditylenchus destructor]|nr:zinc finger CCCH domain-containing protein 10 [Ditylenchus destructor]